MALFVAVRDLRFASGRFALMAAVVALISLLVVLLSGLTDGLARESTSAITGLPADHLVFSAPVDGQGISFAESAIDQGTLSAWRQVPGVRSGDPLGVTTTHARAGGRGAALSAFGVAPGSPLAPDAARIAAGEAVLSTGAADALGLQRG